MKYLVDTNVMSALAPTKKQPDSALAAWLNSASSDLYLSVVTAAEIRSGIAKAAREGATRKAGALTEWWQLVEHLYADRILPFDLGTAVLAGSLIDKARGAGFDPGFADAAIAATALARGSTLLTQNVRHFACFGIAMLNPFDAVPSMPPSYDTD